MITGSNDVYYTPVDGYAVSTFADGIISGGDGGSEVITSGVRFLWIYNPDYPYQKPSGFTGQGWFENEPNTPITIAAQSGLTLQTILDEFANDRRTHLNDVFGYWQTFIRSNSGTDYITPFQGMIGIQTPSCWINITG